MPKRYLLICLLSLAYLLTKSNAGAAGPDLPNVFCADPHAMAAARAKLASGDSSLKPALDRLLKDAQNVLELRPHSVMEKKRVPPSGDKHDYLSQAPYYWADTNSPDGRYIRRDGERNPEEKLDSDAGHFGAVCSNTHTLGLAYYFSGDEHYAAKATEFVRVWFLNPATRMNPNLNFGQGVPGEVDGRPAGLIGTRGLVELLDGISLLAPSKSWTPADQQALSAWMSDYFSWLTTSKIGRGEADAANNHGTFYDTQATAIALFLGRTSMARELLLQAREKRIAKQIEPDGRQPRELARTLSFNYSLFNLRALTILASLGQNVGVDLWHYQTPDGRSIFAALKFVSLYADPAKQWPYRQIHARDQRGLGELLFRTGPIYADKELNKALKFYDSEKLNDSRLRLLYRTAL